MTGNAETSAVIGTNSAISSGPLEIWAAERQEEDVLEHSAWMTTTSKLSMNDSALFTDSLVDHSVRMDFRNGGQLVWVKQPEGGGHWPAITCNRPNRSRCFKTRAGLVKVFVVFLKKQPTSGYVDSDLIKEFKQSRSVKYQDRNGKWFVEGTEWAESVKSALETFLPLNEEARLSLIRDQMDQAEVETVEDSPPEPPVKKLKNEEEEDPDEEVLKEEISPAVKTLIESLLEPFSTPTDELAELSSKMGKRFASRLYWRYVPDKDFFPTRLYPSQPEMSAKGSYIGMNWTGETVRIMLVDRYSLEREAKVVTQEFHFPVEMMTQSMAQVSDFLVSCVYSVMEENLFVEVDKKVLLAFVFSFTCQWDFPPFDMPFYSKEIGSVPILSREWWSSLKEAIDRHRGLDSISLLPRLPDSAAHLLAGHSQYGQDCRLTVLLNNGGCDASYIERTKAIKKFDAVSANHSHEETIVLTELGTYGDCGELGPHQTKWDTKLHKLSPIMGKNTFDKMTAACYQAELVRLLLEQLVVDKQIFGGIPSKFLSTPNSFLPHYISEIIDDDETWENTRRILDELLISMHNTQDYLVMREVCTAISQRAAGIVAAAINALMTMTARSSVTVVVGGTLYRDHLPFRRFLEKKLAEISDGTVPWKFEQVEDGGCKGAVLVAEMFKDRSNVIDTFVVPTTKTETVWGKLEKNAASSNPDPNQSTLLIKPKVF